MKAQGGNVNSYIGQADLFPFPLLYPLKEKKYLSIQKVLLWSVVLSCISGACIYYFIYMKKNNTTEQTSEIKSD